MPYSLSFVIKSGCPKTNVFGQVKNAASSSINTGISESKKQRVFGQVKRDR
jgi:hypothetical protein